MPALLQELTGSVVSNQWPTGRKGRLALLHLTGKAKSDVSVEVPWKPELQRLRHSSAKPVCQLLRGHLRCLFAR